MAGRGGTVAAMKVVTLETTAAAAKTSAAVEITAATAVMSVCRTGRWGAVKARGMKAAAAAVAAMLAVL